MAKPKTINDETKMKAAREYVLQQIEILKQYGSAPKRMSAGMVRSVVQKVVRVSQ